MMIPYLSDEEWKDIPGYEGLYQASSHGRIRTAEGKTTSNRRFRTRIWQSRIMKGRGDNLKTGRRVSLWKDGEKREFLVARLVATTFLGAPEEGATVNHKDGNRLNNELSNLEWLSLADNIRHGYETGLYHCQKNITVASDGMYLSFRSLSQLDRYLERRKGYTSGRIAKSKDTVIDSHGKEYRITEV